MGEDYIHSAGGIDMNIKLDENCWSSIDRLNGVPSAPVL